MTSFPVFRRHDGVARRLHPNSVNRVSFSGQRAESDVVVIVALTVDTCFLSLRRIFSALERKPIVLFFSPSTKRVDGVGVVEVGRYTNPFPYALRVSEA